MVDCPRGVRKIHACATYGIENECKYVEGGQTQNDRSDLNVRLNDEEW
jgi:hypothetical protein